MPRNSNTSSPHHWAFPTERIRDERRHRQESRQTCARLFKTNYTFFRMWVLPCITALFPFALTCSHNQKKAVHMPRFKSNEGPLGSNWRIPVLEFQREPGSSTVSRGLDSRWWILNPNPTMLRKVRPRDHYLAQHLLLNRLRSRGKGPLLRHVHSPPPVSCRRTTKSMKMVASSPCQSPHPVSTDGLDSTHCSVLGAPKTIA